MTSKNTAVLSLAVLLLLSASILLFSESNADDVNDDDWEYVINGNELLIKAKTGKDEARMNDFTESPWLDHVSDITEITIDNKIVYIGKNAFKGLVNVTTVYLSSNASIGESSFEDCTSLGSISINDVNEIGKGAFKGCTNLTTVTFLKVKSNEVKIDDEAFKNCEKLNSISFSDCNISSIGEYCFEGCILLKNLILPTTIDTIEKGLFFNCVTLSSITTLEESTTLVIPNTITTIGESAFEFCNALTAVGIPQNVEDIGDYAFRNCENLKTIEVDENNDTYSDIDGVLVKNDNTIIQCPMDYENHNNYTVPSEITTIYKYGFYKCKNLQTIAFSNTVTIGDFAFCECRNLTAITFGSVASIGNSSFKDCEYLGPITLPTSLKSLGEEAFRNCVRITGTLTIPASLAKISKNAFNYCTGITALILVPDGAKSSLTTIEEGAFEYCVGISNETLVIPQSVSTIGKNAFHCLFGMDGNAIRFERSNVTSISFGDSSFALGGVNQNGRVQCTVYSPNYTQGFLENYKGSDGMTVFNYYQKPDPPGPDPPVPRTDDDDPGIWILFGVLLIGLLLFIILGLANRKKEEEEEEKKKAKSKKRKTKK